MRAHPKHFHILQACSPNSYGSDVSSSSMLMKRYGVDLLYCCTGKTLGLDGRQCCHPSPVPTKWLQGWSKFVDMKKPHKTPQLAFVYPDLILGLGGLPRNTEYQKSTCISNLQQLIFIDPFSRNMKGNSLKNICSYVLVYAVV